LVLDRTGDPAVHEPLVGDVQAQLARVGAALDRLLAAPPDDPVTRRAAWTGALSGPLPEHGSGADAVLAELTDLVVPNGTRLAEPGFWGWITTGPATVPVAAAAAASVAAPQRYTITAFNLLEGLSLDWLAQLCGLGDHMKGVYSSGGSVANLVALGAARQWAYEQRGIDPALEGTAALRPAVYASAETHHTIQRSAAVLGLGRRQVRLVPTDARLRMQPQALREMLEADIASGITPVAVVATAGTTNTGSIDPLRATGELAREYGAWFHVDGAYGLPGVLDDRVRSSFDGLELADSVIVDPHKWLNAPIGVAATFVRDRAILQRAFTQEPADYLESVAGTDDSGALVSLDAMGVPYADMAVELSAPSRGVVVWSILRELGRDGVTARVRADNDLASRLASLVRAHPRLELMLEPELSICCFRYAVDGVDDLDALNLALLRQLHLHTPYLPSSTRVHGSWALRPCFINPRTTPDMVDAFAAAVVRLGDELAGAGPSGGP
jgi:aromatic-L-amino-acid/L-tryptophan decarboxylase